MSSRTRPIGIFDSGIGGLTVAASIRQALPNERLLYFGDNAHIPYGDRSLREVRAFSASIARALMARGCKLIVIACNTASAAALVPLREAYPMFPFIGMEPAVKPAVERSRTRVVGVMATQATFQGELFASVKERFAQDAVVLEQPCPGLVQRIEGGEVDSPATDAMLRRWLEPMLQKHMDVLVLACTHYPLARTAIQRICGPEVEIVDPAPAVARRVQQVLRERAMEAPVEEQGSLTCLTSGDPLQFDEVLRMLDLDGAPVAHVDWHEGALNLP